MTTTTITSEPTTVDPSSGFSDFILHRLHVAALRAKIVANEFESTTTALSAGLISVEADPASASIRLGRGVVVIETPLTTPRDVNRAAQSTYDACLWILRTYGTARLADAWMLPRLAEFSPEQMQELIAAMRRLRASGRWPNVTDDLVSRLEAMQ